jgi:hypothetical protein
MGLLFRIPVNFMWRQITWTEPRDTRLYEFLTLALDRMEWFILFFGRVCGTQRLDFLLFLAGDPCQPADPSATPGHPQPIPVKRGPGRPRLRPVGPGHQGTRGPPRPRKAPKPLPVPLRSGSGTPSSVTTTPSAAAEVEHPRPFGFYTQGTGSTE